MKPDKKLSDIIKDTLKTHTIEDIIDELPAQDVLDSIDDEFIIEYMIGTLEMQLHDHEVYYDGFNEGYGEGFKDGRVTQIYYAMQHGQDQKIN